LASLDHISQGRIGWNVVTSMFDAEARNHSMEQMPASAQRYVRAAEFIDVALAVWDSWDDDAVVAQRNGDFDDAAKIHPVDHAWKQCKVEGLLNIRRGRQGHQSLFQDGASESGRELAAQYGEGIYTDAYDQASGQQYYADVKQRIAYYGRDRAGLPYMRGF